ncbi:MAG: ADP-ribosylglycohydrolase family protein [Lachnospiraceae bacterium]|nr:ADP-ribosylglycohydrolase family protein [Lachnospiraceae bacterium]
MEKGTNRNLWLDGVMGVVTGDALGCPVQFMPREEIRGRARGPVTGMEGNGTYDMPVGTWTDDSSMTLALLDSICETGGIDLVDIMGRFVQWMFKGAYTPFGRAFDIGGTTMDSVGRYAMDHDVERCGGRGVRDNGNGSLMRILPVCLYGVLQVHGGAWSVDEAIRAVHGVSGLTHNHLRAKIGCGLYFFMVQAVIEGTGALAERPWTVTEETGALAERLQGGDSLAEMLQAGVDAGFAYYEQDAASREELAHYRRLRDLEAFAQTPESAIRGSGYVVEALEAAVWSLLVKDSLQEALLCAVNLGDDTDSVAAIAGGLAGLYYGHDAIPAEWLAAIQRREWIEELCMEM